MQQLKPSVIQPPRTREFLQQLTWLHFAIPHWMIGLPLKVDPLSVTPPCFVYFQPVMGTVEMFEGRVRISPYPELEASTAIDALEHLNLESISQQTDVSKKTIAIRATQAIKTIESIVETEQKLRSS